LKPEGSFCTRGPYWVSAICYGSLTEEFPAGPATAVSGFYTRRDFSRAPIPRKTQPREAEQQHRPG
jgi:hypothetical protein